MFHCELSSTRMHCEIEKESFKRLKWGMNHGAWIQAASNPSVQLFLVWKVKSVINVLCWGWTRFYLMHTSPDMVGLNPFDNLHLDVARKNTADDEDGGHSCAQSWRRKSSKWINSILVLDLFPLSYCNLEPDHAMCWYLKCVCVCSRGELCYWLQFAAAGQRVNMCKKNLIEKWGCWGG